MDIVKLTAQDLAVIIEISQMITDYKYRRLQSHNWQRFESEYLPRLVDQLAENSFRIHKPDNNTFTWLRSQIYHSRHIIKGLKINQCPRLEDLPIGQEAIRICTLAARGKISYTLAQEKKPYPDLFLSLT